VRARVQSGAHPFEAAPDARTHGPFWHAGSARDLCRRDVFEVALHERRAVGLGQRVERLDCASRDLDPCRGVGGRWNGLGACGRGFADASSGLASPPTERERTDQASEPSGGAVALVACRPTRQPRVLREVVRVTVGADERPREPTEGQGLHGEVGDGGAFGATRCVHTSHAPPRRGAMLGFGSSSARRPRASRTPVRPMSRRAWALRAASRAGTRGSCARWS